MFSVPAFARLVRGNTLVLKRQTYVEAAQQHRRVRPTILLRHILPGTLSSIVVYFSMRLGTSIITAASLSFLGMGAQPPTPEWGAMLSEARADMVTSPHVALFPWLAIFFTVLAFNLLGDGCATRSIRRSTASDVFLRPLRQQRPPSLRQPVCRGERNAITDVPGVTVGHRTLGDGACADWRDGDSPSRRRPLPATRCRPACMCSTASARAWGGCRWRNSACSKRRLR